MAKLAVSVDEKVVRKLAVEARMGGLSLDDFVNNVLEDHLCFYRYTKRVRAITVRAPFIDLVFNQIPDHVVKKIGCTLGEEQPKKALANFEMDYTLENAVKLVQEIFGRRSNLFEAKIDKRRDIWEITLHHGINRKWSIFISEFVSAIFSGVGAYVVKAKIDDFKVELQIRVPLHKSEQIVAPKTIKS